MNCIIIDDEPLAIKVIEKYLEQVPNLDCRATFSNPLEALHYLNTHSVDLLFLDINMPDLSGLGFTQATQKKDTGHLYHRLCRIRGRKLRI